MPEIRYRYLPSLNLAPSPATIIFSLPCFEPATCLWSDHVKPIIKNYVKNANIVILYGNDATPARIHQEMAKVKKGALGGVGHGNHMEFTAQNFNIVYWTARPEVIKNDSIGSKLFAPVSCLVGRQLAPFMVKEGGMDASIGETIEYTLTSNGVMSFINAEMTLWKSLDEGKILGDAYNDMLKQYEVEASKAEANRDPYTARFLRLDAANRKMFGDPGFKLIDSGPSPSPGPGPSPSGKKFRIRIKIPATVLEGEGEFID